MIIENRELCLARSFALSVFKMVARFFDVSESEIDQ